MNVQVITRDGEAEYAVLPWADYQALLAAAGQQEPAPPARPDARLDGLQALREARGLSQAELARMVGISPHYLQMIESAERQPDQAILHGLARALDVSGWTSD